MGLPKTQKFKVDKYKGKPYVYGVSDCFTLIKKYYKEELNISIPDYEYSEEWWKKGQSLYLENMKNAGFEKIKIENIKPNDILLIKIQTKEPCHAAIYLGDEKILHHVVNRLSNVEELSGYWYLNAVCAARYIK